MNKTLLISAMFIAAAFVTQSAQAGDIKIRAGVGSSTYALGGDYTAAKSSYSPVSLGLSYAADNGFYVDLGASGGTGTHDGWATANSPTTICGTTSCGNVASPSESFQRADVSLIVGGSKLNQNNGIAGTLYVGLKTGSTVLGSKSTGLRWTEETFDSSGVVFGGGVSFPIASGRAGSVGVNAGLGLMSANWKDTTGFNMKADAAAGVSFGLNYTYPITSYLGAVVDYKINSYSYKFTLASGNTFMVNESIGTLGASAYLKF